MESLHFVFEPFKTPTERLQYLLGNEEQKQSLRLHVIAPMLYPAYAQEYGMTGSVLLYSPTNDSGSVARALVGELADQVGGECPLLVLQATEFDSSRNGYAEQKLAALLEAADRQAQETGASAILIENLDDAHIPHEAFSGFLKRVEERSKILVLCTTRAPWRTTQAFSFERQFYIGLPDQAGRESILRSCLEACDVADVDVAAIAAKYTGFSREDFERARREAQATGFVGKCMSGESRPLADPFLEALKKITPSVSVKELKCFDQYAKDWRIPRLPGCAPSTTKRRQRTLLSGSVATMFSLLAVGLAVLLFGMLKNDKRLAETSTRETNGISITLTEVQEKLSVLEGSVDSVLSSLGQESAQLSVLHDMLSEIRRTLLQVRSEVTSSMDKQPTATVPVPSKAPPHSFEKLQDIADLWRGEEPEVIHAYRAKPIQSRIERSRSIDFIMVYVVGWKDEAHSEVACVEMAIPGSEFVATTRRTVEVASMSEMKGNPIALTPSQRDWIIGFAKNES